MTKRAWQIVKLETVGSTNDEAKKFCRQSGCKTVITARKQTNGRGRGNRIWNSLDGNLFFSMAFEFDLQDLGALIIISSLSLWDAVKYLSPEARVQLKWPNDVLLNDAKVSGMLLEKGEGNFIIVGIGVNIVAYPQDAGLLYPATSLRKAGINISAEEFLHLYLQKFDSNLIKWRQKGIENLQQKWLQGARGIGQKIVVQTPKQKLKGCFAGIDKQANLLLSVEDNIIKILAGDVFYLE